MAENLSPRLLTLHQLYTNPNNPIFLTKNIDELLKFTKKNPKTKSLTRSEILKYQSTLSQLSRDREVRILRNRRRALSYRRWKVFAPNNILLGDIFFLRPIKNPKHGKRIPCLIFMDAFSRLVYCSILKSTKSAEVASRLQDAFTFFGPEKKFKKFCSDRLVIFRETWPYTQLPRSHTFKQQKSLLASKKQDTQKSTPLQTDGPTCIRTE